MVKIEISGEEFVIDGGEWSGSNKDVLWLLRQLEKLAPFEAESAEYFPGGEDERLAFLAVKRLGAKIIEQDDPPDEIKGVVY